MVHSDREIRVMITQALRPFRYADGKGYFFITAMDGTGILNANDPTIEGKDLLDLQDSQGKNITKDMTALIRRSGEGFYEYNWEKPDSTGNDFKKISYIKLFEPYQWFIGSGLYVDDLEESINAELLSTISRIRFGREGYIFINRLNGDALVSNGEVFSGTRKLWEEFDSEPAEMEAIFQLEYEAAQKPDGDYIYYSHVKLSSPDQKSPKASYILGIPEKEWLIGAGVYLDDVENEIEAMRLTRDRRVKEAVFMSLGLSLLVIIFFLLLFSRLSRNLRNDTDILVSFLEKASFSKETINRDSIHFDELDRMAKSANKMLEDKLEAKDALRESEKRFLDLAENSSDWIWEFDENEIFTYVSPSVKDILGYSPEELLGQSAFDPMSSDEQKRVSDEFLHHKSLHEPFSQLINVNRHKDGTEIYLESSGIPIFDGNGRFCGYRGIDRDITVRLEYEEQLRQAHKMEAIGTLAGGIAHDFNNILAAIMGYAELAKLEMAPSDRTGEHIDEIIKASSRAGDLVRHILSFSRKEPRDIAPVRIAPVAGEVAKLLRATIPASIEIQTDIDPDCGQILANGTQLHQIILNLCTNACQAMEGERGILQISLHNSLLTEKKRILAPELTEIGPGSYVELIVRDNGPGIDPHVLNKIFDPYFTTKDTGKGSGIGLAVVQGIAKSFSGIIEVESDQGKGSSFHIYFPEVSFDMAGEETGGEIGKSRKGGHERILLVDDEKDILAINKERLLRLGYEVISCIQAEEALDLIHTREEPFDLVITDQSMPGITGERLSREILKIHPGMSIIMCTGYSSRMNAEKAATMGIKDFLMKPVTYNDLAESVRRALDNP